jgi:hypothetical protein
MPIKRRCGRRRPWLTVCHCDEHRRCTRPGRSKLGLGLGGGSPVQALRLATRCTRAKAATCSPMHPSCSANLRVPKSSWRRVFLSEQRRSSNRLVHLPPRSSSASDRSQHPSTSTASCNPRQDRGTCVHLDTSLVYTAGTETALAPVLSSRARAAQRRRCIGLAYAAHIAAHTRARG